MWAKIKALFNSVFSRKSLSLNDDERQNLTTYSMMGGTIALTIAIGLLVWVLRYSWPGAVAIAQAPVIMDYLFKIIMAFVGLQAIQILAQAAIAIGGKIAAKIGPDGVEASADASSDKTTVKTVTEVSS